MTDKPRAWNSTLPRRSTPMKQGEGPERTGGPKARTRMKAVNRQRIKARRAVQFGTAGYREHCIASPCLVTGQGPCDPAHILKSRRMSARKMWATRYWRSEGSQWLNGEESATYSVRVLVQEMPEGMPDFEPGDRVRINSRGGHTTVLSYPFADKGGTWRVAVDTSPCLKCWSCDDLTKLPRETSVLLRVTGPEEDVEAFARTARTAPPKVRVERVEDES